MVLSSILRSLGRIVQRGPGRVGQIITQRVPYMQRVTGAISRITTRIPGVRVVLGGSAVVGIVAIVAAWVVLSKLVM